MGKGSAVKALHGTRRRSGSVAGKALSPPNPQAAEQAVTKELSPELQAWLTRFTGTVRATMPFDAATYFDDLQARYECED
jgi:hypothetical protein